MNAYTDGIPLSHAERAIGPGWAPLVQAAYLLKPDGVCVTDVKQKYGALRISVGGATMQYHDVLDALEAFSLTVCEQCGAPGKPRPGGWIYTLCAGCVP